MDMYEELKQAAERYSEKSAIVFKGQKISFDELHIKTAALAGALKKKGVGKGDKIGICLPNCPEYVYCYLACFFLGAVGVPLDFMLKRDELVSCLSHAQVKLLIAAPKGDVDFLDIRGQVPSLSLMISCHGLIEGVQDLNDLISGEASVWEKVAIEDSDPALIMYTSGTTGKPKGILLNHKHLEGSPAAMDHFVDLSEEDIKLVAIPLSHIGGFVYIQNCIKFGISLILMERFNPFEFLQLVTRHKVTCFHIVPAMYNAILSVKQMDKFDLKSLRWVVVFGAPSSPEILERFHQYCPNARLLNGWGMTETCPPNTVTPLDSDNIASVGKPAPNCEIRVFDENDKEMQTGEIGEIVIRGWVVMECYYKDAKATSEVKRNGWLHTGDLGRFDQDGFLYIVGRKKEMIKVAGQIVYAPEVESAFYKHKDVAEVAVIGMSDKLRGEVIKAFVVLKEGANLSSDELTYFAKEHLAHFKVPQTIELRENLPKNRTGKIDKEQLKQG